MAWDFDEGGKFGRGKAAEDYARCNGLNDADLAVVACGRLSMCHHPPRR